MKYDLERRALIARAKGQLLATMEVFSTGLVEEWRERLNSNRPGEHECTSCTT